MTEVALDKIVDKIAGLGVPGLVLVVVMASTGLTGGAAIVTALSILGGPLGMWGGIAVLMVSPWIVAALAQFGVEKVFGRVLRRLKERGHSIEEITKKVDSYPISSKLKQELKRRLAD